MSGARWHRKGTENARSRVQIHVQSIHCGINIGGIISKAKFRPILYNVWLIRLREDRPDQSSQTFESHVYVCSPWAPLLLIVSMDVATGGAQRGHGPHFLANYAKVPL